MTLDEALARIAALEREVALARTRLQRVFDEPDDRFDNACADALAFLNRVPPKGDDRGEGAHVYESVRKTASRKLARCAECDRARTKFP